MIKEKFYSAGCDRLLRAGVSLALVAGMSVPSAAFADVTTQADTKAQPETQQLEAKEKTVDTTATKDVAGEKTTTNVATDTTKTDVVEKDVAKDATGDTIVKKDVDTVAMSTEQVSLLGDTNGDTQVTLEAEDAYLTDKVEFNLTGNGVYISVKGTKDNPRLYIEPISGDSATLTAGFYDWETYKASDFYTSIIAPYADKITKVDIKDGTTLTLKDNCACLFSGLPALTDISDLAAVDVSGVTYTSEMFSHDSSLTDFSPISGWHLSSVKSMYMMFAECTMMTSLSFTSGWTDTTSLTDISGLCYNDPSLVDISALGNWDLSKLEEIYNIFSGCKSLSDISVLANIDVSNVKYFTGVFGNCSSLSDFSPVSEWNTENGIEFSSTFAGCAMTDTNDIAGWKTGSSLSFYGVFAGCPNLTDLTGVSKWDTSKSLYFREAFAGCTSLETLDGLEGWDVSAGQTFYAAFMSCTALKDVSAIGGWQPGSALDMQLFMAGNTELETVDLSLLANDAPQTYSFYGIDTSKVRHFKVTEDQADTEKIMQENNICDLSKMEGTGLYYRLRGTETTYDSWTALMADFDTVSGQWIDVVEPVTVNFYTDTDVSKEPFAKITGEKDAALGEFTTDEPEKLGYKFANWYYVKDGQEIEFTADTVLEGDTNVFAKWNLVEYTITYQNTKDATNTNVAKYTIEDKVTLVDLAKTGYEFQGWTKVPENGGLMSYVDGAITEIPVGTTGNIVLTANWKAIPYTITYKGCEDATNNNPVTYTIEDKVTLNTPSKAGYKFLGWSDATGKDVTEIPSGSTGNVTVTARWIKDVIATYHIKYTVVGGTIDAPEDVAVGEDFTVTYKPLDGYKLKSITVDGVELDDLTDYQESYTFEKVNADHEINVVFEEDKTADDVIDDDATDETTDTDTTDATDEAVDAVEDDTVTGSTGTSVVTQTSSENMPQTGDTTLYATLMAAITGAGALGVIGRQRALSKSLKNRKH